jgi:hypothetical protein
MFLADVINGIYDGGGFQEGLFEGLDIHLF